MKAGAAWSGTAVPGAMAGVPVLGSAPEKAAFYANVMLVSHATVMAVTAKTSPFDQDFMVFSSQL